MTKYKSTWISSIPAALPMAFLLVAAAASASEPGDTDSVFDAKAKELIAGKSSRQEKIMAVHAFARDFIRQVETKFS